ncbi:antitoxin Xre/MbcA/ParS toxin-binding domain-containing protein [Bradyrhizobium elkanii]|uniref:antitoxin Xre/MbcA/ParS toxin-binding domain-containing protein n=1 Tax=Bradyrhizobium elkanii TaxID=29448 RepID=UPI003519276B
MKAEKQKILKKAAEIFGSQEEATRWLATPAMGLDQQRPVDLIETREGAELVETFLGRIEFGAYT